MNGMRYYFPVLLVLVAVVKDTGARGKNCSNYIYFEKAVPVFIPSAYMVFQPSTSLSRMRCLGGGFCLIFVMDAFRFHRFPAPPCAHTAYE